MRELLLATVCVAALGGAASGCVSAGEVRVETAVPGADVYVDDHRVPVGKTPVTVGTGAGFFGTPAARIHVRDHEGRRVSFDVFRREVTWRAIYLAAFGFGGASLVLAGAAALIAQTGLTFVAVGPAVAVPGGAVAVCALLLIPILPLAAAMNVFAAEGTVLVDLEQGTATGEPAELLTTPLFWLGPPDMNKFADDDAPPAAPADGSTPPAPLSGGSAPPPPAQGY